MEFEERATCWGCGRDYLRVATEKWPCLDMLCEGSAARSQDDDSMGDICPYCNYDHGGGGVLAYLNRPLPEEDRKQLPKEHDGTAV